MFKLEIETWNAAFMGDAGWDEVARILRAVADKVQNATHEGTVSDINGNRVGSFTLTED